jgi:hypothetical protein
MSLPSKCSFPFTFTDQNVERIYRLSNVRDVP